MFFSNTSKGVQLNVGVVTKTFQNSTWSLAGKFEGYSW